MNVADTEVGMISLIAGPSVLLLLMWAREYDKKRSRKIKTRLVHPAMTVGKED